MARRMATIEDRAGVAGRNTWESLKRLLNYMQAHRAQLVIVVVMVIIYTICYTLGPYLLGVAIDQYVLEGDLPGLARIVSWMLVVYVGMWLSGIISGRVMARVAQRISTVLTADKILVLDHGNLVAEGKHAELLESSPIYKEIFDSQLGGGVTSSVAAQEVSHG